MHDRATRRPQAVVIGASAAGLFAAAALSDFADVTIVESDTLPQGPEHRRGVPQAHHAHLVWSGGVTAFNTLLPGIVEDIVARGARLVHIMGDMVSRAPNEVWFRRFTATTHHNLVCSRPLLDAALRDRVLGDQRITLHQATTALRLEGNAQRVTGVRIRADEQEQTLHADMIIDASGRGSHAPTWLQELGLPAVTERKVDAGVAYATRLFKAPGTTQNVDFPLINVQANPAKSPGQGGIILPIENGEWIVTLSGTRGGEPTKDPNTFLDFALSLGNPIIGELLKGAEPIGDVATTRSTANRRRYYEKMTPWPDGFVVLGDAIAGYNPVYGHGLTVAAQCALALRTGLHTTSITAPGTARRLQQRVTAPAAVAWDLAVGQDARYPGATDSPPSRAEKALAWYVDQCVKTGASNPRALGALLDVMSLTTKPTRLFAPDMLIPMLFGPRRPHLPGPPLNESERGASLA